MPIKERIAQGTSDMDPWLVEDRSHWDMEKIKQFIKEYRPEVNVDEKTPKELDTLAGSIQKENL